MDTKTDRRPSASAVAGVIALVFLIIGYQTALFVHRAAVAEIAANRDTPDTVFVYMERGNEDSEKGIPYKVERRRSPRHPAAEAVRSNLPTRNVESFSFNPNTVSIDDLCRLGFTLKQAQSIDSYRKKGGRFRRKSDFAKSFVVSDSVYKRLEPYIDIPLLDLNQADSAAFDGLPGIGGWYASKMIEYRKKLGGYSYKEQLMEIWKFDKEKFDALSDLIVISPEHMTPYPLWTLPADSLRLHPYIGNYETARAIVLFRDNSPKSSWTVEELAEAGILSGAAASRLSRCIIEKP
mgnify:FL=1